MPALVTESIAKTYPSGTTQIAVLRDVTLAVSSGQSAGLMGPSGAGKSTLLNILGTLEWPSNGRLRIHEQNPFDLSPPALAHFRNARIGFVFQEHHLLPQLSVLENVLLPTLAWGRAGGAATVNKDDSRARALLERVGLSHRLDHRPGTLSGGERQRAALARALINGPQLVLADEPTGNLDAASARMVGDLLLELCRQDDVALVVATHSPALADRFDACYELRDGTLKTF